MFPVITALGTVVNGPPSVRACAKPPTGCPGDDACVLLRDETKGVDVRGGGSGPVPLFTLRLSGGSSGTALSFFLELLLVTSLPLAETAVAVAE